jgi:hypothetical protein
MHSLLNISPLLSTLKMVQTGRSRREKEEKRNEKEKENKKQRKSEKKLKKKANSY